MEFEIIGLFDKNKRYCSGSLTKFLTSYVGLSLLADKYDLTTILDDPNFLDSLCQQPRAREFLTIFQEKIGSNFSLRDICSHYTGLPYTFDLAEEELNQVELNMPFKHQSILNEKTFLSRCKNNITPVYKKQCKFHYSELGIIFLGYFLELTYNTRFEDLYHKYLINKFNLKHSIFSRRIIPDTYIQDLSNNYDYPSIGITDHGYFCYSNGFYTTLNDMKLLLENMISTPVFQTMIDYQHARAASPRIMNGLSVEIRKVQEDIIYGYEGLSFSGCSLWAYSTKLKKGYLTFHNSEEAIYTIIYDRALGYSNFDAVSESSQILYKKFLASYHETYDKQSIPDIYQGNYHRININNSELPDVFILTADSMTIRNPEEITYPLMYHNDNFWVKGKDGIHSSRVGLYTSQQGNHYFFFDGDLYKKIVTP